MSYYYSLPLVNDAELAQARAALGPGLSRILGYFREDGVKSIVKIEEALVERNAAAMVIPAHTLKGESRQFGAKRLAEIAEVIEKTARQCIERHVEPDEVASEVAMLRACFLDTLDAIEPGASALPEAAAAPQPAMARPQVAARPTPFANGPRTFGRRTG